MGFARWAFAMTLSVSKSSANLFRLAGSMPARKPIGIMIPYKHAVQMLTCRGCSPFQLTNRVTEKRGVSF